MKCSRVLTRKETVLLLSNLLAIKSKKMKETIEAFLQNFQRTKLLLHFFCVPTLFSIFQTLKILSRFLEKSIFRENNFREFLV